MQVEQCILLCPSARTPNRSTSSPRFSTESPASWQTAQSGAHQEYQPPCPGAIQKKVRRIVEASEFSYSLVYPSLLSGLLLTLSNKRLTSDLT